MRKYTPGALTPPARPQKSARSKQHRHATYTARTLSPFSLRAPSLRIWNTPTPRWPCSSPHGAAAAARAPSRWSPQPSGLPTPSSLFPAAARACVRAHARPMFGAQSAPPHPLSPSCPPPPCRAAGSKNRRAAGQKNPPPLRTLASKTGPNLSTMGLGPFGCACSPPLVPHLPVPQEPGALPLPISGAPALFLAPFVNGAPICRRPAFPLRLRAASDC